MTENKFTPGRWEIASELFSAADGRDVQWRWVGPVGWKTRVCRVVFYDGEEAEQEANAHLIAAAPELFEALERIAKAKQTGPHDEVEVWELQAIARQALSRARGGE